MERFPRWFLAIMLIHFIYSTPPVHSNEYNFTAIDFPGAGQTVPQSINNSGVVVGWYSSQSGFNPQGFVYDGKTYQTIAFPGAKETQAYGINDLGQIVGWYRDNVGSGYHGFLYDSGSYISVDYNELPTCALDINNFGKIVGYWCDGSLNAGFVYDGITFETLYIGTDYTAIPKKINDSGKIVGSLQPVAGADEYVLIFDGIKYTFLSGPFNTYASGRGINNNEEIVGYFQDPNLGNRGFLYSNGSYVIIDFDSSGSTYLSGINDAGLIVGWNSVLYVGAHGFLLTPPYPMQPTYPAYPVDPYAIPLPSTLLLLGSGLLCLGSWRSFKKRKNT